MKGLRRAGASTLEQADRWLDDEFLPDWDQRFGVKAASEVDAHRAFGEALKLESILSWVEQRQVTNDYTVSWEAQHWQIPKEAVGPGLRRFTIRIEARLDGSLRARIDNGFVVLTVCKKAEKSSEVSNRPARRYVPPAGQSRWIDQFSVKGNEAWKDYRQQGESVSAPLRSPSRLPPLG